MNFFQQQDRARTRTTWLLGLFALAILAVIGAAYSVFVLTEDLEFNWRNPQLFVATTFGVLAVVLFAMFVKAQSLRGGGGTIAESVGGRRVHVTPDCLAERRLLNIVEEMAIASGLPVPAVYVLPQENGINAFAAGFEHADAAIVVTQGALDVLTRDELQGVVAHEFSHILNGDMRLNIRMMGVLFGIMVVGMIGRAILRSARYSSFSSRKRSCKGF